MSVTKVLKFAGKRLLVPFLKQSNEVKGAFLFLFVFAVASAFASSRRHRLHKQHVQQMKELWTSAALSATAMTTVFLVILHRYHTRKIQQTEYAMAAETATTGLQSISLDNIKSPYLIHRFLIPFCTASLVASCVFYYALTKRPSSSASQKSGYKPISFLVEPASSIMSNLKKCQSPNSSINKQCQDCGGEKLKLEVSSPSEKRASSEIGKKVDDCLGILDEEDVIKCTECKVPTASFGPNSIPLYSKLKRFKYGRK